MDDSQYFTEVTGIDEVQILQNIQPKYNKRDRKIGCLIVSPKYRKWYIGLNKKNINNPNAIKSEGMESANDPVNSSRLIAIGIRMIPNCHKLAGLKRVIITPAAPAAIAKIA